MDTKEETCSNCRFGDIIANNVEITLYKCRLYAPKPNSSNSIANWATVRADDWCGEYNPKSNESKVKG